MEKDQSKELVSICMPAYNAALYIKQTIDCLLNQTYKELEIIVVDDGSTDETINILKSHTDPRLTLLRNPKKNAASARNHAYLNCIGRYIVFFDADDLIPDDFIEKQVAKLKTNENAIVVSRWGRFYDNDVKTYEENRYIIQKDLTYEEWILAYWYNAMHTTPPGRLMFSRKLIEQTPLWDECLSLNDDFQFFNELFYQCDKIFYNEAQFYYRSGIGGLSSKKSEQHYLSCYDSLKRGLTLALSKYPNNESVKLCCANMWQNLKYELYPQHLTLIEKVDKELSSLPKPDFKFQAGGWTNILAHLCGWKFAKLFKAALKR